MQLTQLTPQYFSSMITLANQVHGDNYLDEERLLQMQQKGLVDGKNASFVALDNTGAVVGYRLSFAAGQWSLDKWCSTTLWSVPPEQMAYFKSVAVSPVMRGKGIATALLNASIEVLKQQGARAGLAHIWRESPDNAAERYFSHAGANILTIHPNRWRHLSETQGYHCPVCGSLCNCSAAEMELKFAGVSDV